LRHLKRASPCLLAYDSCPNTVFSEGQFPSTLITLSSYGQFNFHGRRAEDWRQSVWQKDPKDGQKIRICMYPASLHKAGDNLNEHMERKRSQERRRNKKCKNKEEKNTKQQEKKLKGRLDYKAMTSHFAGLRIK